MLVFHPWHMAEGDHQRNRHEHLHKAGVMVAVYVAPKIAPSPWNRGLWVQKILPLEVSCWASAKKA